MRVEDHGGSLLQTPLSGCLVKLEDGCDGICANKGPQTAQEAEREVVQHATLDKNYLRKESVLQVI